MSSVAETAAPALIICGSPRAHGVSARYVAQLEAKLQTEKTPVVTWSVAAHVVQGCTGCEGCRAAAHTCVINDDMQQLYRLLDAARCVHVVCPVYFSGPTSQFKAVLDRLQPYWELRRGPACEPGAADAPKRSVTLHVIGQGGDSFGYDALVSCVRSAFGAAGWSVVDVVDCIGWGQQGSGA